MIKSTYYHESHKKLGYCSEPVSAGDLRVPLRGFDAEPAHIDYSFLAFLSRHDAGYTTVSCNHIGDFVSGS